MMSDKGKIAAIIAEELAGLRARLDRLADRNTEHRANLPVCETTQPVEPCAFVNRRLPFVRKGNRLCGVLAQHARFGRFGL